MDNTFRIEREGTTLTLALLRAQRLALTLTMGLTLLGGCTAASKPGPRQVLPAPGVFTTDAYEALKGNPPTAQIEDAEQGLLYLNAIALAGRWNNMVIYRSAVINSFN